jgi:bacillithiol system protein YtxJ
MINGKRDSGTNRRTMNWKELKALDQLEDIKKESTGRLIVIFKHSTRCNISRMTLDRLERQWSDKDLPDVTVFFLDLLQFREISNAIATQFNVDHQSPQVLVIANGKSVLDLSHFEINFDAIKNALLQNSTVVGRGL